MLRKIIIRGLIFVSIVAGLHLFGVDLFETFDFSKSSDISAFKQFTK